MPFAHYQRGAKGAKPLPDEYRGEAPVAFVKLKEGATATASEIKAFLQDRLSKIEMPREIIFRDSLPKTLIGKLCKRLMELPGVLGVRVKIAKLEIFDDCEVAIRMETGQW